MTSLELERIGKTFPQGVQALADISLTIAPGECIALVGPSGCGKSTLLRIVAGLETPTSGTVHLDRKPVNHIPTRERNVGFVFQRPALYPHLSVRENIAFGWKLANAGWWRRLRRSVPWHELEARILEMSAFLRLETLLDRYPRQLSGGEQQRVALGRALVRRPRLLLLDEPLSNLDAPLRAQMTAQLQQLRTSYPVTTILVTHDPTEAAALGDRIVSMERGRIQRIDPTPK